MLRRRTTLKIPRIRQLLRLRFLGVCFWMVAIISYVGVVNAQKAVLFGASGAVGSEVLNAVLQQSSFWKEVILVGRRRIPRLDSIRAANTEDSMTIVDQIVVSDLQQVKDHETLVAKKNDEIDACFIAIGVSHPYNTTLYQWNAVEVNMIQSITNFCNTILNVKYIALLSGIDPETNPEPYVFSDSSSSSSSSDSIADGPLLGWWGMLQQYCRITGLKEKVFIEEASSSSSLDPTNMNDNNNVVAGGIPYIRIFQPSNIVTEYSRYGWLDRILFQLIPYIDPIVPKRYHSVTVRMLGMAMVADAIEILTTLPSLEETENKDAVVGNSSITRLKYEEYERLTHGDYLRINGNEYYHQKQQSQTMETEEL